MRFFHGDCDALLRKLEPQSRIKLLANVDILAADTFWVAAHAKNASVPTIRNLLLQATQKFLEPLGINEKTLPTGRAEWIKFEEKADEQATAQPAVADPINTSAPVVVIFDEKTGKPLNKQVVMPVPEDRTKKTLEQVYNEAIPMPWQEWHKSHKDVGALEADKATAVAALHALHEGYPVEEQPIEIRLLERTTMVVTTSAVDAYSVVLPPCVPQQSHVNINSKHPNALGVTVTVNSTGVRPKEAPPPPPVRAPQPADKAAVAGNDEAAVAGNMPAWQVEPRVVLQPQPQPEVRSRRVDLHPEFRGPRAERGQIDDELETAPVTWTWSEKDDETMHPFWAVRRITQKALAKENLELLTPKRFNCEIVPKVMSSLSVALIGQSVLNCSKAVEVPMLTNIVELAKGEELLLEKRGDVKKDKDPTTWKSQCKAEEAARKKLKTGVA